MSLLIRGGVGLTTGARASIAVVACVALAIAGRARRAGRRDRVGLARQRQRRAAAASAARRKPLWQRLYLDLVALALSGLIYWLTAQHRLLGRRQPRLEPDAVAVGLHVLRARRCSGSARRCCSSGSAAGRSPGSPRGPPAAARARRAAFLLASAGRRGAAINRGLIVVGLLLAFGVNLGIFTATYDQQANVDAAAHARRRRHRRPRRPASPRSTNLAAQDRRRPRRPGD